MVYHRIAVILKTMIVLRIVHLNNSKQVKVEKVCLKKNKDNLLYRLVPLSLIKQKFQKYLS